MPVPRLGAAKLIIEWSDAEGFVVRHGSTNEILAKVEPEFLETGDWEKVWRGIRDIEVAGFYRTPEGKKLKEDLEE